MEEDCSQIVNQVVEEHEVRYTVAVSIASEDLAEEKEEEKVEGEEDAGKEEEGGEKGSSTKELALASKQVATLWVTTPAAPKFWALGPSKEITGCRPTISKRVWMKAPTM